MKTPLDLFKGLINFQAYYTWGIIAIAVFSIFLFFKRKYDNTHSTSHSNNTTTWKGYLTIFAILLIILSFVYLCFFKPPKDSSTKYTGQLITEIDKAIDKYDETLNNFKGLKTEWESELKKCEDELKKLYEEQEITQEQKAKITQLLETNKAKIEEIKQKMDANATNIAILKGQLVQLEDDKKAKEQQIVEKQRQAELASPDDRVKLQAEISQLQDQVLKLVDKIAKIGVQIADLEAEQKMYEEMLETANHIKTNLKSRLNDFTTKEKELFGKIQTAEERSVEIQKEIDAIDKKIEEIEVTKEAYQILKETYSEMYNRMATHEAESAFNFGNATKAIFKGVDMVTDLYPPKLGLKVVGKTLSFTRKFAQRMTTTTLVVHEGHRLYNMIMNVVQKNEDHPLMITKEMFESYQQDIRRDLDALESEKQQYTKRLNDYKERQLTTNFIEEEKIQIKTVDNFKSDMDNTYNKSLNEYSKVTKELISKQNKTIGNKPKLEREQNDLIEEQVLKDEIINDKKEELKQKNPSYARAQNRIKERRDASFNELGKRIIVRKR